MVPSQASRPIFVQFQCDHKTLPSIGIAHSSAFSTLQLPSQLLIFLFMTLAMHHANSVELHKLPKRTTVLLLSKQRFETL